MGRTGTGRFILSCSEVYTWSKVWGFGLGKSFDLDYGILTPSDWRYPLEGPGKDLGKMMNDFFTVSAS